jgi:hypothetical protein
MSVLGCVDTAHILARNVTYPPFTARIAGASTVARCSELREKHQRGLTNAELSAYDYCIGLAHL